MSRNFLCAMFGIAMTLFSWWSPWAWPAAPALGMIRILVGTQTSFADLPYATRAMVFVVLIVINVAAWAIAAMIVAILVQRLTARRRSTEPV
ncbi:MAG: hypothetical protein M3041_06475 [Acidobacteriota bacterium]|nr:hypothetical protein [Acidobacteriota bacterium]